MLLSILGTDSEIADKYYTHVGDFAQRQAVEAISLSGKKSAQDKVNEALALLKSNSEVTSDLREQLLWILG